MFNEPPSINLTTFNRTIDASASCASPSPLDTTGVRRTSVYGTIGYIMVGSSEKQIPILFKKTRRDAARQYEQEEVRALLTHLAKRLHTNSPINRMEIGIDYPKNQAGHVTLFDVTLAIQLASGPRFVSHGKSRIAKAKGVGLGSAIREAFSDIEAQYRKLKRGN
ncbi:MAG TPA: hypothetical protein VJC20_03375 [Candidatus Paceibacterota bacterium]